MPFLVHLVVGVNNVIAGNMGLERLAKQLHPYFRGGAAGFAMIACLAGADQILPLVLPPEMAWDNVVEGELSRLLPAVLAGIPVAVENLAPCQPLLGSGALDHVDEADY